MSNLIDIGGIAEVLDVSKNTAYRMARAGEIPSLKVRGHWRFDAEKVLEHLAKPKDVWAQPPHSRAQKRAA